MPAPPRLHYEWQGDPSGPPVVFLHGFLGSGRDWAEVIDLVRGVYHCLTIDLPGHGKSLHFTDRGAYALSGASLGVAEAMHKAGVRSAPMVGYSMGGRLAMDLAIHHEHLCSGLVLESASAGIPTEKARAERLASDEKRARELEQGAFEDFLPTWYAQPVFASLRDDVNGLEEVLRRRRFNEPGELAKALRGMSVGAQAPLWESLPGLNIPVLLVAGERDSKYANMVRQMAARLPHATVKIIPGVGHNCHVESPSEMARHIKEFLQGVLDSYGDH